jgi:predicted AlkP superfamily pyrophosphatase or phosphodiesterase
MLPAAKTHRFSLAEVLPNCLSAVRGERGALGLAAVRHAVVVLADGLGRAALDARAGHARRMLSAASAGTISAGFPTTTTAALATLTTGEPPGRHGLVGYDAYDPAADRVVNLLHSWGAGLDPATWQRMPTVFERADDLGVPAFAIGPRRYRDSGFSAAVLRGARHRSGESVADRFRAVRNIISESERSLSYLYVPELDTVAHQHGVESPAWTAALDTLDAAVGEFAESLGPGEGMLVTADHGMLDVSPSAHVLVPPDLLSGVRHVAGEPRCLQLHLDPGFDPDTVAARWRDREGSRAWIATRDEAIAAGWFGEVDVAVRPRIGEVLIAARKRVAYYAHHSDRGRGMVGQHGSLTADETAVPLLRFGAFA